MSYFSSQLVASTSALEQPLADDLPAARARVAATVRRLLDESGDRDAIASFDLDGWVAEWMKRALPELGGKTPEEALREPKGIEAIEQVIERMRGGLAA